MQIDKPELHNTLEVLKHLSALKSLMHGQKYGMAGVSEQPLHDQGLY